MVTKIMLVKDGNRLAPADPWSSEALDEMSQGEIVNAAITRPRNAKFHRKFFAFLNLIFENQTKYQKLDQLLTALKQATGHGEYADSTDGKSKIFIPASISFARCDEASFDKFYNSFVAIVVRDIIPGLDEAALEAELEAFIV